MEGRGQPRFDIVQVPADLHLPDRLERSRPVLVDALMGGAEALLSHAGFDGPDGITVEQRVVLTHPDATVKDYRASRLSTLLHCDDQEHRHGHPADRRPRSGLHRPVR